MAGIGSPASPTLSAGVGKRHARVHRLHLRTMTAMASPRFDFDEFVKVVKDLNYDEILAKTQEEIYEMKKCTAGGVRGAPAARKAGAGEYLNLLKGIIFALSENRKPSSVQPWDLIRMRPIWESLVSRGQLKPESLRVFD